MPPKKNKQKSQSKPKKALSKKAAPKKKTSAKKVLAKKALTKKAPARKALARKAPAKKAAPKRRAALKKRSAPGTSRGVEMAAFEPEGLGARAGGQAGNLQGVSDIAEADSESVEELLEEGNAFEAEVVEGVEDAPAADAGEIKTHEVPEDDVPEEYIDLDKDQ